MLASATDIAFWANRRDAQDMLPRLIRRLIHATVPQINRIGFPAGEGVQLGGWDGILDVEHGNAFVPDGISVWELGSNRGVKGKADADYGKRTADPLGITPSEATFVFVTPRRWANKSHWETDRKAEGTWCDVRAFDADDLEAWLEIAPAVHVWLSIHLGKHPHGAIDGERYWQDWANVTNPVISPELVLAGRQAMLDDVHRWFNDPSQTLTLKGESRAEASAVFVAAIQKLNPARRVDVLSRVVVVRDAESWNQLIATGERLILLPEFESAEAVGRALQHGHAVVLPLGRADGDTPNAVDIPRLSGEEAASALTTMGMAEDRVHQAAAIARRSLTSLRRHIAILPAVVQPNWARPENARSLIPALLAGRWSDQIEGDRQAIGALAKRRYDDVSEDLVRWANENDPPIRCVGSAWYLGATDDAWALLGRYLTRDDLAAFEKLALDVLGRPDPGLELTSAERLALSIQGQQAPHSGLLQAGLCNSLAVMGARGESVQITGGQSLPDSANRCVRQLLESDDWRVWASLPLPLIAEAAPAEFLAACDRGLKGDQPFLRSLFAEDDDELFSSSPHVSLLFALETLAWCPEHLPRAALVLAILSREDPGGQLANRPQASLDALFLPWSPQTTASLERRLTVLDLLREKTPSVAWKIMLRSLPKFHDSSHPTAKPRWREWAPEDGVRVSPAEYANAIHELVARVLNDADVDGTRWADVLETLPHFPPDEYEEAVGRLEKLDPQALPSTDLNAIWHGLRALVSMHRSYADADWALPKDRIDRLERLFGRLEPPDLFFRFGWLFGDRPLLPEAKEDDWHAQERAVVTRQDEAVRFACREAGLNWIPDFCDKVERPALLGAALARADSDGKWETDLLRDNLDPDHPSKRRFAAGFIHQKARDAGIEWATRKLDSPGWDWTNSQRARFCLCLPFNSETWDIVEGLDAEAVRLYWQRAAPVYVDLADVERVVRRLLDHERPYVAIDVLSHHARSQNLPGPLVADSLEQLLRVARDDTDAQRHSAHDIGDLLRTVAGSAKIDAGRVAALEWAFLPALGRHFYSPKLLHRELSRNPEFFAEIVRMVFRAEGEEACESSEEESARAERGYELLESWRTLPGTDDTGTVDHAGLREWVLKARDILRADNRLAIGDHTMGQIFSGSPGGVDGAWPHQGVRDLIEELASDDFEQGLVIGLLNSEGVVWRNPKEGGKREKGIAELHEKYASIVGDRWVRTAAMLRRIRDRYLSRARDEDQANRLREDLST